MCHRRPRAAGPSWNAWNASTVASHRGGSTLLPLDTGTAEDVPHCGVQEGNPPAQGQGSAAVSRVSALFRLLAVSRPRRRCSSRPVSRLTSSTGRHVLPPGLSPAAVVGSAFVPSAERPPVIHADRLLKPRGLGVVPSSWTLPRTCALLSPLPPPSPRRRQVVRHLRHRRRVVRRRWSSLRRGRRSRRRCRSATTLRSRRPGRSVSRSSRICSQRTRPLRLSRAAVASARL